MEIKHNPKEVNDPRKLRITKLRVEMSTDEFKSIWIKTHEKQLQEAYNEMLMKMPLAAMIGFDGFADHMFRTVPVSIEHNAN